MPLPTLNLAETASRYFDLLVEQLRDALWGALQKFRAIRRVAPWPVSFFFPAVDLVAAMEALDYLTNQLLTAPAQSLLKLRIESVAAIASQSSTSKLVTERDAATYAVDVILDAAQAFVGVPGAASLRFAARIAYWKSAQDRLAELLFQFLRPGLGTLVVWLRGATKPLRALAILLNLLNAALTYIIVLVAVFLISCIGWDLSQGGIRRLVLRQDSRRLKVDLPPKRLRWARRRAITNPRGWPYRISPRQ